MSGSPKIVQVRSREEIQKEFTQRLVEAGHQQFMIESLDNQLTETRMSLSKTNDALFKLDAEAKKRNELDAKEATQKVSSESV